MPENNPTYEPAVAQIAEMLPRYWLNKPKHAAVHIYTWPDREGKSGLRVSEVSLSNIDPETGAGSGASFMQSDVDAGTAIFAVERAILEQHDFNPAEADEDLVDAKWRAVYAVHDLEAAKAFEAAELPPIK